MRPQRYDYLMTGTGTNMSFGILGLLEVRREGRAVRVPPGHVGSLLAVLLLHNGEFVPDDLLVARVWGDEAGSIAALRTAMSRLRRELPGLPVENVGGGYRLLMPPDSLDAARFLAICRDPRLRLGAVGLNVAVRREEATACLAQLRLALGEWRGGVLAGSPYWVRASPAAMRLEEMRRACACRLGSVAVALGTPEVALPEITHLTADNPYDEPLHATHLQLLVASGRPAQALRHYEVLRRRLRDELGTNPSEHVQQAYRAALTGGHRHQVPQQAADNGLNRIRRRYARPDVAWSPPGATACRAG
jgi:DNA-binding SARP family transcriptional activator